MTQISRAAFLRTALALLTALLVAPLAIAQSDSDLDRFRAQGIVMERFDGFLELADPGSASGAAKALVERVNGRRRALYEKRAQENGVPMVEVGKIYAAQILEKAPSGTKFKGADGSIQVKP
ncbi:MAG: YdbL family protein [Alphaproteobacteria bacterium]